MEASSPLAALPLAGIVLDGSTAAVPGSERLVFASPSLPSCPTVSFWNEALRMIRGEWALALPISLAVRKLPWSSLFGRGSSATESSFDGSAFAPWSSGAASTMGSTSGGAARTSRSGRYPLVGRGTASGATFVAEWTLALGLAKAFSTASGPEK